MCVCVCTCWIVWGGGVWEGVLGARARVATIRGLVHVGAPLERARETLLSNPRLLMSSWGVLGRLEYVNVSLGFERVSVSAAVMEPRRQFYAAYADYGAWLAERVGEVAASTTCGDVSALESAHGDVLRHRMVP